MLDSPVKIKHTSCQQKAQEEVLLGNTQDQEPRKFSFDGGSVVSACGHNFTTTPSESTSDSLIVDPSDIIDDAIWNIGAAHDVTVPRRSSIMSSKSDLWKWSFEENDHELLRKEREDYPLSHHTDTIFFDQQMSDVEQNQIMPPLDETMVVVHPNENREASRSCLPPSRPSRRHAGLKRNQTMKTLSEPPPTAAPVATRTTTLTYDEPCNPADDFPFLSCSRSLLRSMKRTIRTQDRIRKEKKKIKLNDTFVDKDVLQELMYCMQDSKKSREKVRQFLVLNQM